MFRNSVILVLLCVVTVVLSLVGGLCHYMGRVVDVASEQLDPALLLKKYEWFKESYAQCDRKRADIEVYKKRLAALKASYGDTPRAKWDRTDKEQYNLWEGEVAGVIASYNDLAAEYNAAMAKINYRFTNVGDLPRGATEPLPREVQPYKTE